jgi:GntR family transcriptional regulator
MKTEPLYSRVYNSILEGIHTFEYPENAPLPSERALCTKYRVSRSTVRQALDKLQADGYIYILAGNGSFVKPQIFEQPLTKFYSFTDELKNSDTLIYNEILDYDQIKINNELVHKTKHPADTLFHRLVRLRSAKNYPLMLETTYLPQDRFPVLDVRLLEKHGSLYAYLMHEYPFNIDHATETLRPILPGGRERELLNISSSIPCTSLQRFSYEERTIIEYTESIVRGDKYFFTVNLINR